MKRAVVILTLTSAALGPAGLQAQTPAPQPIVRAVVEPETVAVGEPVELQVTVLVPTWFPRPPVYPSFELANAIVRRPPDSSYPLSERIGRDTWSGIVRKYRIYPLIAADYRLSGQQMTVTIANPGSDPITVNVDVPEISFRGSVPDGAQSLVPYIAGSSLTLTLDVEGQTDDLAAGDALVLQYRAELDGLPAIFIPTLAPAIDVDGVSVYVDEPEVIDDSPASRAERMTLVFDAGGEFSVPAVTFDYWNTGTGNVEQVGVDGLQLSVTGPALLPDELPPAETDWRRIGVVAAAMLGLLAALWRGIPAVIAHRRAARERWMRSEACAFNELQKALRSDPADSAYAALLSWLQSLQPGLDARDFASRYGDEDLYRDIDGLAATLFSDCANKPDLRRIGSGLARARANYLNSGSTAGNGSLPPLNPTAS